MSSINQPERSLVRPDAEDALRALLGERILVLDGAMGTMIQAHELDEAGYRGERFAMRGSAEGPARPLVPGSEGEFITEHYWGYTRQRDGGTLEYRVEHPPWKIWEATEATFEGDTTALYGPDFAPILREPPQSAFIAVGSEIAVYPGQRIAASR